MSNETTFTLEEIKQGCEPLWNNVECLTCSRLLGYIKDLLSCIEGRGVEDARQVYADGFCAQCSELARPLTRALESTGVPTGEAGWQQSYGPNKVRAFYDLETCLRQLLFAIEDGKHEKV